MSTATQIHWRRCVHTSVLIAVCNDVAVLLKLRINLCEFLSPVVPLSHTAPQGMGLSCPKTAVEIQRDGCRDTKGLQRYKGIGRGAVCCLSSTQASARPHNLHLHRLLLPLLSRLALLSFPSPNASQKSFLALAVPKMTQAIELLKYWARS